MNPEHIIDARARVNTDEYSDIDLMILTTNENRPIIEAERIEIAQKVGKIRAELMARPHTYVVIYEPHGIKMDYAFHPIHRPPRPDKAKIEILYDPDGVLKQLVEKSSKIKWEINMESLENHVKHFFVTLAYFTAKVERGEPWEARDTIEWYRGKLVTFEHILAKRKQEGYRFIESRLTRDKLKRLEETIPERLDRLDMYRKMDAIIDYFNSYLHPEIKELNIYPEKYADRMLTQYNSMKSV